MNRGLLPAQDVVLVAPGVGGIGCWREPIRAFRPDHDVAAKLIHAGTVNVLKSHEALRSGTARIRDRRQTVERILAKIVAVHVERDDIRMTPRVAELVVDDAE